MTSIEQTAQAHSTSLGKSEKNEKLSTKAITGPSIKVIEIVDLLGTTRYKKDFSSEQSNLVTIPVDKLNNGIYIMKIFDGIGWKSEKLIIQH